jgi:hypothetical protein
MRPRQIDLCCFFIDKQKYKQPDDEQNMHQKQETATVHAHMQDPSYVAVVLLASPKDQ